MSDTDPFRTRVGHRPERIPAPVLPYGRHQAATILQPGGGRRAGSGTGEFRSCSASVATAEGHVGAVGRSAGGLALPVLGAAGSQ